MREEGEWSGWVPPGSLGQPGNSQDAPTCVGADPPMPLETRPRVPETRDFVDDWEDTDHPQIPLGKNFKLLRCQTCHQNR